MMKTEPTHDPCTESPSRMSCLNNSPASYEAAAFKRRILLSLMSGRHCAMIILKRLEACWELSMISTHA